ncbi:MAG: hypoxanthine-guanine phosphoribosyltransferase [Gammaproteobacteria bacterium]|nr:hypoxanthine-guanine phosphoribosyltransferase [Gammaproteobacteria bacterium]
MTVTPEHVQKIYDEADCLHTQQQVEAAIAKMGEEITAALADKNPLLLCVLTGAIVPTGQLLTHLDFPLELDYLHATRYSGNTTGGELHWIAKPRISLQGRVVLVVDDILDEGHTLAEILGYCHAEGASEVYSAVLVEKHHNRKQDVSADFVGLDVEDRYVFGYGMDYKDYLRNAPGIFAVKE